MCDFSRPASSGSFSVKLCLPVAVFRPSYSPKVISKDCYGHNKVFKLCKGAGGCKLSCPISAQHLSHIVLVLQLFKYISADMTGQT